MPTVEFLPSEVTVELPAGTDLLAAARKAGLDIESPCGGQGRCGKCVVRVVSGEADFGTRSILPASAGDETYVLACRTRVAQTPLTVEILPPALEENGQFVTEQHLLSEPLLGESQQFDPLTKKLTVEVPPPQPQDGLSDLDRLKRAIREVRPEQELVSSLGPVRVLADALRNDGGRVSVTLGEDEGKLRLIAIDGGDCTDRHFALAVDVGTTTLGVGLIDLSNQKLVMSRSAYNAQVSCGLDVISRINYARRAGGLEELRTRVLKTINDLLTQGGTTRDIDPSEITSAVISGNTTMIHLLLGLNPDYIRLDPYTPTVMRVPHLSAREVGIEINPDALVRFSPCVGSYVGGDITAGLLCTDLIDDPEEISMFVDIGTNGELVVGNKDFLLGCACSAGPAFEGGGIACGVRAARGAIERVDVDRETGEGRCFTIGNAPPQGICGSGMIDLLANLFLTGWIDRSGKLNRDRQSPFIDTDGKQARYTLVGPDRSATAKPINVGEVDIENIIRAKAAIYSAASLMLEQVELEFGDLSHVYVAGSFGRFLDLDKAITLGLLPDLPASKFRFIGNASLRGSCMAASCSSLRRRQQELSDRITYFDLSTTPSYMNQYTAALFLPHTDLDRFPSVAEAMKKVNE